MTLLLCSLITLAVLFYVFYLPGKLQLGPEKTRLSYLRERKDAVYENLRDLNFEYNPGRDREIGAGHGSSACTEGSQGLKRFLSPKAGSHLAPIPPVYFIIAGHRGLCWRSHWRTVLTGIAATTILFTCTSAFAQTLTGTVTNGTTKKPASDDDVVLIKLGQGMEEAARTKTDPNGNFTFKLDAAGRTSSAPFIRA